MVFDGEGGHMGQTVRFQETLRRQHRRLHQQLGVPADQGPGLMLADRR